MTLFYDPTSFFRSNQQIRWGIAVPALVGIQLVGVSALFTKMAQFIPNDSVSGPVIGYVVGLAVSTVLTAIFNLGVAFVVFWVLTWFLQDRVPTSPLLATFCYALIPGQLATLAVRLLLIVFSSGDTPLTQITNATSLAAFVDEPSAYLKTVDPFVFWSALLLTVGYTQLTGGKHSKWLIFGVSMVPLVISRMV